MEKLFNNRVKLELKWLAASALESLALSQHSLTLEYVDKTAKTLSKAHEARITFIAPDGVVMGDSNVPFENITSLDNHGDRAEIQQAQKLGLGHSVRYSHTLKENLTYVAVYKNIVINNLAVGYYARAALPQSSLVSAQTKIRLALFSVLITSIITLVMLSYFSSRWISKSVEADQAELKNKIDARVSEIEQMHELDSLLSSCSQLNDAASVINQVLPNLLSGTTGAISVYKSSRDKLTSMMFWGDNWPEAIQFTPGQCWALRKGHNHQSQQGNNQLYCQHLVHFNNSETLCMPLMALGETIGVMHVIKPKLDRTTTLLAKSIAKRVGLAIANIELRYSLRQQAIKDTLTGLYNRRYLFEFLEQLVARAIRQKATIGIVMLDIDHFKKFNDTYGHDTGDHVLKEVSNSLKKSTRSGDVVSRYGGEEFCLVCSDCTLAQTLAIAEKICVGISELVITLKSLETVNVTISAGVAIFPDNENTFEGVISVADKALYLAKKQGRNCARTVS